MPPSLHPGSRASSGDSGLPSLSNPILVNASDGNIYLWYTQGGEIGVLEPVPTSPLYFMDLDDVPESAYMVVD